MELFELQPASLPSGRFAADWFDDEARTWNDARLGRPEPLARAWQVAHLLLHRPAKQATPVLFNPNAVAISSSVKARLEHFQELEFLPVEIERHGTYFVIHVVACADIPRGAVVVRAPPSTGNIVKVESLPMDFTPPASFFRLLQPPDSPAGRMGLCTRATYMSEQGRSAIAEACGSYLSWRPIPTGP